MQLEFRVVDHYPTEPFTAYWDGASWQVADGISNVWSMNGAERDAVPSVDDIMEEQAQLRKSEPDKILSLDDALKLLAVSKDPAMIKQLV